MTGFDVLDPKLNVHERRFIEASAGTGKTFTLQHLIVRLLLSDTPLSIERILVVTFTRAATSDLKRRVRETLIELIENFTEGKSALGYVQERIDRGESRECTRRLRLALSCFEEAKIYTIHSFCFQALQESAFDVGLSFFDRSEESSQSVLKEALKDLFREPLDLTPKQLGKLFKGGTTLEDIFRKILRQIQGRTPISLSPTMEDLACAIKNKRQLFKESCRDILLELAPNFGKCTERSKNVKSEIVDAIEELVSDGDLTDSPLQLFSLSNLLKRADMELIGQHQQLLNALEELCALISLFSDELRIFAHVCQRAQKKVQALIEQRELLFFDDLILKMQAQLNSNTFLERVRGMFDAVLIDEFQDTNPIQWQIFNTLFGKEFSGPLILVGDPKQAIYRFRQADIYTYLAAKNIFLAQEHAQLDRNYRSSPALVDTLNALFTQKSPFLQLPKNGQSIFYTPVLADTSKKNRQWKDPLGSVILLEAEEEQKLLEHSLAEVIRLHKEENIALNQCAFLVKDRFQAKRLQQLCENYCLPAQLKGQRSLIESETFDLLELFIKATLYPQEEERIKRLLGTPLFNYSLSEISRELSRANEFFYRGRDLLYQEGIFSLFTLWKKNYGPRLIGKEELLYSEFEQLFEALAQKNPPLSSLLHYLDTLRRDPFDEEIFLSKQRLAQDAIQIMTIHVSKGLEYQVVFPIGLALSPPYKKELVYDEQSNVYTLDEQQLELHAQELESERIRQLYVALTRPKERLYLPFITEEKRSPIAQFLEGLSLEIPGVSRVFCTQTPSKWGQKQNGSAILCFKHLSFPLFSQKRIDSFSSLYQAHDMVEKLSEPSFPTGPEVGSLVHYLLEKLPLDQAHLWDRQKMETFAYPFLQGTLLASYEQYIGDLLWRAWNIPLPNLGLSLSEIDPQKIRREPSFLYPTGEGMLKGFIDVLVEHQGVFYIIDWKSNHLDGYAPEYLERECKSHNYYEQARIYKEAVSRYLSMFGQYFEVGPALYCFLRGFEKGNGVICL